MVKANPAISSNPSKRGNLTLSLPKSHSQTHSESRNQQLSSGSSDATFVLPLSSSTPSFTSSDTPSRGFEYFITGRESPPVPSPTSALFGPADGIPMEQLSTPSYMTFPASFSDRRRSSIGLNQLDAYNFGALASPGIWVDKPGYGTVDRGFNFEMPSASAISIQKDNYFDRNDALVSSPVMEVSDNLNMDNINMNTDMDLTEGIVNMDIDIMAEDQDPIMMSIQATIHAESETSGPKPPAKTFNEQTASESDINKKTMRTLKPYAPSPPPNIMILQPSPTFQSPPSTSMSNHMPSPIAISSSDAHAHSRENVFYLHNQNHHQPPPPPIYYQGQPQHQHVILAPSGPVVYFQSAPHVSIGGTSRGSIHITDNSNYTTATATTPTNAQAMSAGTVLFRGGQPVLSMPSSPSSSLSNLQLPTQTVKSILAQSIRMKSGGSTGAGAAAIVMSTKAARVASKRKHNSSNSSSSSSSNSASPKTETSLSPRSPITSVSGRQPPHLKQLQISRSEPYHIAGALALYKKNRPGPASSGLGTAGESGSMPDLSFDLPNSFTYSPLEKKADSTLLPSPPLLSTGGRFRYSALPERVRLRILTHLPARDLSRFRQYDRVASSTTLWAPQLRIKHPSVYYALHLDVSFGPALAAAQMLQMSNGGGGVNPLEIWAVPNRARTTLRQVVSVINAKASAGPPIEFWLKRADEEDRKREKEGGWYGFRNKNSKNTDSTITSLGENQLVGRGAWVGALAYAIVESGKRLAHGLRCTNCVIRPRTSEAVWCSRCGVFACGPDNFSKRCVFKGIQEGEADGKITNRLLIHLDCEHWKPSSCYSCNSAAARLCRQCNSAFCRFCSSTRTNGIDYLCYNCAI